MSKFARKSPHFKMVFKDKTKLETVIRLRRVGWTYQSLAWLFGVDHTSIYSICKTRGIPKSGNVSFSIIGIISEIVPPAPHEKTYLEYVKEYKDRHSLISQL